MLREEALLRELEETLGKLVEWRGFALKNKQDHEYLIVERDRLKISNQCLIIERNQLKEANEYLIVERDRLKEAAAEKPASPGPSASRSSGSSKELFKKVRALLSKGLHPDRTKDIVEKKIRTKLFQDLWPQINNLENA